MYINPYGKSAKKVTLTLKCIETNPSGSAFKYTAHFTYDNKNATPVYVPIGPDNKMTSSAPFTGTQTTEFKPGYNVVDFQFNGQKLTWSVKTNDGTSQKSISEAYASSSSTKCTGRTGNAVTTSAGIIEEDNTLGKTGLYPNPATTKVVIDNVGLGAEKTLTVFDMDGRSVIVPVSRKGSQQVELDVRNLQKGIYYIRLQKEGNYQTLSFIKL